MPNQRPVPTNVSSRTGAVGWCATLTHFLKRERGLWVCDRRASRGERSSIPAASCSPELHRLPEYRTPNPLAANAAADNPYGPAIIVTS